MASGTWNVDATGNWSLNTNWLSNTIADGAGFTANFTNNITAARTVTVDTSRTIGSLVFSDSGAAGSARTLAGAAGTALTLDNGASQPTITSTTATFINAKLAGTNGFVKSGGETLEFTNTTYTNTITGTIRVTGAGGTASYLGFSAYASGGPTTTNVNVFPGTGGVVPDIVVAAANDFVRIWHGGAAQTISNAFSGLGCVSVGYGTGVTGNVTFAAGALTGLTGVAVTDTSTSSYPPNAGISLISLNSSTYQAPTVIVNDFPRSASFWAGRDSTTQTQTYQYVGTSGSTFNTQFLFSSYAPTTIIIVGVVEAAQAAGSALLLSGNVLRGTDAGTGTVTFRLTGTNANDNTLSGVIQSSIDSVNKAGTGRWILSGTNTYTTATSISAGTLSIQNNNGLGASGSSAAVTVSSGATLEITGGRTISRTSSTMTLGGTGAGSVGAIRSVSGTNSYTAAGYTLSTTATIQVDADKLTLGSAGAITGISYGITKTGAGELHLTQAASTFTGAVTVSAGTLTASVLANAGTSSSLGTGAGTPAIALTGTLKFAGSSNNSTSRSITFTGSAPALEAAGTGSATVTYSACSQAAGARTIGFTGANTANNTFSATLADGTGAVGIAKSGAGKWILSGTMTNTGLVSCSEGTLDLGSTNRSFTGGLSVSGGTVQNSTNTITAATTMTGGIITAALASTSSLTVSSGTATLNPTNNANTFTGATDVASGAILNLITGTDPAAAGAGKVLGNSAVTVTGAIKTSSAGSQGGKMRYGTGGVTFKAGSSLHIGGA